MLCYFSVTISPPWARHWNLAGYNMATGASTADTVVTGKWLLRWKAMRTGKVGQGSRERGPQETQEPDWSPERWLLIPLHQSLCPPGCQSSLSPPPRTNGWLDSFCSLSLGVEHGFAKLEIWGDDMTKFFSTTPDVCLQDLGLCSHTSVLFLTPIFLFFSFSQLFGCTEQHAGS